ncbi:MAG: hypothetical protein KAR38_06200, partial [Calditrichia bacterium]|nr:hypothetical protein [Calditrichia bacterium]
GSIFNVPVQPWKYSPVQFNAENNSIKIIKKAEIKIKIPGNTKFNLPVNHNLQKRHYETLKRRIHNYSTVKLTPKIFKNARMKTSDYNLDSGKWIKIKIENEGIYKLTYNTAEDAGFPVDDVNLNTVKMYGHHGVLLPASTSQEYNEGMVENPIKVIDNDEDGQWDSNDYLIFYGRGAHNFKYSTSDNIYTYIENVYDDNNYYYLTSSDGDGLRIPAHTSLDETADSTLTKTLQLFHYEKSKQNFMESGTEWYDRRFSGTSENYEFDFTLPFTPASSTTARVEAGFKGGSGSFYVERRFPGKYTFNIYLNTNKIINNFYFTGNAKRTKNVNVDASNLSLSNTLNIVYSSSASHSYAYFDFLDIQYYIENSFTGNSLKMYSPAETGYYKYSISNPDNKSNFILINVTDPFNLQEITPEISGNSLFFIENNDTGLPDEYILTTYDNLNTPSSVSSISNIPNLRDPQLGADLLIITSEDFLNEAE